MRRSEANRHPASFRDPSGFLFRRDGVLYRQVNQSYREEYEAVAAAGVLDELTQNGRLIPHEEVEVPPLEPNLAYRVLQPEPIPFISYPYEWSFGQLKDAALLTLDVQTTLVENGFVLKDASAYNVQFRRGAPLLIDTLSFERWKEGEPWVAYRQFCQHFLAPLALMALVDVRLGGLLRVHLDGVPLNLASELLPRRSYLNFGLLTHLHLHASAENRFAGREVKRKDPKRGVSRQSLQGLVENLRGAIEGLEWKPEGDWSDYYSFHNYDQASFEAKKELIRAWVAERSPEVVWDLGANTGVFSRLAADHSGLCVSADFDPGAVHLNYEKVKEDRDERIHPLWVDLTNPSPGIGWAHREREPLAARGPADLVLALALVHHLAIGNNLPFHALAEYLGEIGNSLIIEFVPKSDPQVEKLLISRRDIFDQYSQGNFEDALSREFSIDRSVGVGDSGRTLYSMRRR